MSKSTTFNKNIAMLAVLDNKPTNNRNKGNSTIVKKIIRYLTRLRKAITMQYLLIN